MSTTLDTNRVELKPWLAERVAGYLEIEAAELDSTAPLAELGLDSVYALTLCGDIEDAFGIEVEPTLAWDYPTLDLLTEALREQLGQSR